MIRNLTDVTMEIFTSDLCDTFNNLASLYADGINLESIDRNAFKNCPNLSYVYLLNNSLTNLDQTLFKLNPNVRGLLLNFNRLTTLDPMIVYNLRNLYFLDVSDNQITEFPVKQMPQLRALEMLSINNNPIPDIDEREILLKFPMLNSLRLCPNHLISRDRLKQIRDVLKQRRVLVNVDVCDQWFV